MKIFFKVFSLIALSFVLIGNTFAQTNEDLDNLVSDTKNDLLVVVGGGLAGAILGLSTLSFVEEPKDHTNNIIVGASLGIIAGVGVVAFSQANKTQELLYGDESYEEQANADSIKNFDTKARTGWHREKFAGLSQPIMSLNQVNYSFKF